MNICLYGASSTKTETKYLDAVYELGRKMAERNLGMIFGGGKTGLMGAAARGMSDGNGYILGIAPKVFDIPGVLYEKCSEFIYTDDMSERKKLMEEKAEAFVVVPGGAGTYDELFQVITLKQLAMENKPIGILNVNRYFDPFVKLLDHAVNENFMDKSAHELYHISEDPDELLDMIQYEKEHPMHLVSDKIKNLTK